MITKTEIYSKVQPSIEICCACVESYSIKLWENWCDQLFFFSFWVRAAVRADYQIPREQSKHRWREGDSLKLIVKVINITDIYLAYWHENRTELGVAEVEPIIAQTWAHLYQIILTGSIRFVCKYGRLQILVAHWFNYVPVPGTPQSQQVCHWKHYSHLCQQTGWLDKNTQKVAMIHPLIHHPSVLTSITALPPRGLEKKHFSNFYFQYNCKCKYLT